MESLLTSPALIDFIIIFTMIEVVVLILWRRHASAVSRRERPAIGGGTAGPAAVGGDGNFASWSTGRTVEGVHSLAVADFNGDGVDDVVRGRPAGKVEILLSDGNGQLGAGTTYTMGDATSVSSNYSILAHDLDGDGLPDLVATNITTVPANSFIAVALNKH